MKAYTAGLNMVIAIEETNSATRIVSNVGFVVTKPKLIMNKQSPINKDDFRPR